MTPKDEFEKILELSDGDFLQHMEQHPDLLTEESFENPKIWHYAGKIAFEKKDFSKLDSLVDKYISSATTFVLSDLMCLYAKVNNHKYFNICLNYEKAEPNKPGKYGYPLHWVCRYGQFEILKTLLENSDKTIDLNVQNAYGSTAIIIALENNNINIANYLLAQKNINLTIYSHTSGSVLSTAIYYEQYEFVNALFQNEQLEKISNKSHPSALEWAILRNQVSIVDELLKRGFDPNLSIRDYGAVSSIKPSDLEKENYPLTDDSEYDWYELPLLLAMEHNNNEIISLLLQAGANIEQALWYPDEKVQQIDFGFIAEDYELKNNESLYQKMSFYFSLQQYQYVITDQFDLLIDELYLQSPALLSLAYYFISSASFLAEEAHLFSQAVFPAEFGLIRNQFHLLYCAYHLKSQKANPYPSNKALFNKTVSFAIGDNVERKDEKIKEGIDYYKMLAFKAVDNCMVTISQKVLDKAFIKNIFEKLEKKVKKNINQLKTTNFIAAENYNWLIDAAEVRDTIHISSNQIQESKHFPKTFWKADFANLMSVLQLQEDVLLKKIVKFLQSNRCYTMHNDKSNVILASIKAALYREIHKCSWSCIPESLLSSVKVGTAYYYYRTFCRSGEWEEIKKIIDRSYQELFPVSEAKIISTPPKTAFFHRQDKNMSKTLSSPKLEHHINTGVCPSKVH